MSDSVVPTTPTCTWWNRPEEDNSSGKLESTHPSRTSVKSDQVFFGVESVMRVNADSLLIRAAATSTSGTLNDLTTDLIMANNNNNMSDQLTSGSMTTTSLLNAQKIKDFIHHNPRALYYDTPRSVLSPTTCYYSV